MTEPAWIAETVVPALHDRQLAEHGDFSGLRDAGLLDSALDRPRNLFDYGEPDLCDLAAAYAFGLARNHPFVDGNKRTSFVVARGFLIRNGADFTHGRDESVTIWLALASGNLSEKALADWLRAHLVA